MQSYSKHTHGSVRTMFANIAERYDLLNRLMTLGRDRAWRRECVRRLELGKGSIVADLGCGTGDLAFEILAQTPDAVVIASDFTPEMIAVGKGREGAERICWLVADAQEMPLASESLDACVSGFLLRNVPALDGALREQARLLRKGGKLAALDTTPPRGGLFKPLMAIQFRLVIPLLGRLVAGDAAAYQYLPQTTEAFLAAEALSERLRNAGFGGVSFVRRMLGSIAIHWGQKKGRGTST